MLPPADTAVGVCSICNNPAVLQYRDASTGFRVGQCCRRELVVADAVLMTAPEAGVRHPATTEVEPLNTIEARGLVA